MTGAKAPAARTLAASERGGLENVFRNAGGLGVWLLAGYHRCLRLSLVLMIHSYLSGYWRFNCNSMVEAIVISLFLVTVAAPPLAERTLSDWTGAPLFFRR